LPHISIRSFTIPRGFSLGAGYYGTHLACQAIAKTGGTDGDALAAARSGKFCPSQLL
jgi:hypothetical protein